MIAALSVLRSSNRSRRNISPKMTKDAIRERTMAIKIQFPDIGCIQHQRRSDCQ